MDYRCIVFMPSISQSFYLDESQIRTLDYSQYFTLVAKILAISQSPCNGAGTSGRLKAGSGAL